MGSSENGRLKLPQHNWEELNKEIENLTVLPFVKSEPDSLNVSETFFSLQGEGPTAGVPSVFLRLQGCNLLCKWPCDTIPVWRKGTQYTFEELFNKWKADGTLFHLQDGAHLIITGGEPMLRQKEISNFLQFFWHEVTWMPYIEVETNATIKPDTQDILHGWVNQYNCSPKLSNSKMEKSRRIRPESLKYFVGDRRAIFKFVIENPTDLEEVLDDYVKQFSIDPTRVYLMPECVNRAELQEKTRWVAELCKEYGFNFGNRLQVAIWDQTTGV
jgi:7-carboxy-7-deazaguanine synthase